LANADHDVRLAVTEGLGVWTGRRYFFKAALAIQMLSALRNDESAYVRDSVGNALRAISKKHPNQVKNELAKWDITMNYFTQTSESVFVTYIGLTIELSFPKCKFCLEIWWALR
jgi:hypothetical protein